MEQYKPPKLGAPIDSLSSEELLLEARLVHKKLGEIIQKADYQGNPEMLRRCIGYIRDSIHSLHILRVAPPLLLSFEDYSVQNTSKLLEFAELRIKAYRNIVPPAPLLINPIPRPAAAIVEHYTSSAGILSKSIPTPGLNPLKRASSFTTKFNAATKLKKAKVDNAP